MKKMIMILGLLWSCAAMAHTGHTHSAPQGAGASDYPIRPVSFADVKLTDAFWAPRIAVNQQVTIPIALRNCYSTGRVDNFKKAAGLMEGWFATDYTFDDTDIYKIIEGMSYSIQMYPNAAVEAQMDTLVRYIALAQEPDGYLYTARTAAQPGKLHPWVGEQRWEKDPDLSHELYNCGHLYEAAVAHYEATGKRTLLDVAIKSADLLVRDFGPGKLAYEPGHQIVEMGLAKMYRVTGKREYLDLAKFFLDLKGGGYSGEYAQTHKPVVEQDEAVGHAVRAGYMYSGMADVAALTGDMSYLAAIDRIWDNVVGKKYYINGGVGSTSTNEAYGENYVLPNMSAYCETCASIAMVYWNHRLFLLHGDSKYYDVVERTLYNGLISGVSLAGDRFFYPNPLQSLGQYTRSAWFGCACCPSNVCRFIPSVSGYVYAKGDNSVYVNLFVESDAEVDLDGNRIGMVQTTGYPWDGAVSIEVNPARSASFGLKVRIPGWAVGRPVPTDLYSYLDPRQGNVEISVNGRKVAAAAGGDGYVTIERRWKRGDRVEVHFSMEVQRVIANELVADDRGKVSLERGPLVYCLEWADNDGMVLNTVLADDARIGTAHSDLLRGIVTLGATAGSARRATDGSVTVESKQITAIPYYTWANRGGGEMTVWIARDAAASRPLPPVTLATQAVVSASTPSYSLGAVNDGMWPAGSSDRETPFYSLWPGVDSDEWIQYDMARPSEISHASVYWFEDALRGWRVPDSWTVTWLDDAGQWREVEAQAKPAVVRDAVNEIAFRPVVTRAVRLNFRQPVGASSGVYEFDVK